MSGLIGDPGLTYTRPVGTGLPRSTRPAQVCTGPAVFVDHLPSLLGSTGYQNLCLSFGT